jgi:hypothetical protein
MAFLSPNEMLGRLLEPKTKNRFIFYVEGMPTFLIKSVTLPNYNDGEIQFNHINTYRMYRSGRRKWEDVTIKLFDPVVPNAQQVVMDWARLAYEDVTGRAAYAEMYKKDCTINICDGPGSIIGEWILKGAFIKSTDLGNLDYDAPEEYLESTLVLTYDHAILNI